MQRFTVLISVLLLAVCAESAVGQTRYKTYANARFDYQIKYPVDVLVPLSEAENGDGRVFESKDKTAKMLVWGQYNALFDTLKGAYENDLKERLTGITYKVLLKNGYVISGKRGNTIFYQKTILNGTDGDSGAIFCTFSIEYPRSAKAKFDPMVRRISKSFKFN
ncbi:MAG: hypothetical protein AB7J13_17100 [Pyrinomonadaceae bacterium]